MGRGGVRITAELCGSRNCFLYDLLKERLFSSLYNGLFLTISLYYVRSNLTIELRSH